MRTKYMFRALLGVTSCFYLVSTAQAQDAEVLHYWTSGSEAAAVKTIADAYDAEGGKWIDTTVTGYEAARAAVLSRLAGGDAPTAMVVDLGEILPLVEEGILAPITDVPEASGWETYLPKLVMEKASLDGQLYAAPIDIGTGNWMFYSQKVLDDVGIEPPKTWDEFFADADKIRAKGYIPLAFGSQAWQEALVFRNLALSVGGAALYQDIFVNRDQEVITGDKVIATFDLFARLRGYIDEGATNRNWNDATSLVITDKAAFQIMGDWAKAEFTAAGEKLGTDFGCAPSPGTTGSLMIVSDAFVFPAGDKPEQIAAREKLANLMLSKPVQKKFNQVKGALPARTDVDMSDADECVQTAMPLLEKPEALAANLELALTPDAVGAVKDVITQFWNDPSISSADAAKALAAALDY